MKTVEISADAYDALASLKKDGESFSDVILRITGARTLLMPFAGGWKGAPVRRLREVRKFLRDSDRLSKEKLRRLSLGTKSMEPPSPARG
ncbi:MAG: antitoxin VapB family protein [Thermoplasmata archaeon]|nr:antitoxin VapB family protein [Thermoplasmata archaeon]